MLSAGRKGEKQDRGGSATVSTAVSRKYLDALYKWENKENCLFIRLEKIKKNVLFQARLLQGRPFVYKYGSTPVILTLTWQNNPVGLKGATFLKV